MLQYASTLLDYACEIGLYLMPSDIVLHPGYVQGNSNLIQIAVSGVVIGHNSEINEVELINPASEIDKAFQGKTAPPVGIVHKGPQPSPETNGNGTSAAGVLKERQSDGQATAHEEEKSDFVAAGIIVSLVALRLTSR